MSTLTGQQVDVYGLRLSGASAVAIRRSDYIPSPTSIAVDCLGNIYVGPYWR